MDGRKVEFLGKMPDPFRKEDGTRMTPEEWYQNRAKLRDFVVKFAYDGMPPRPEVVKFTKLTKVNRGTVWYRIQAGSKVRQLTFFLEMNIPNPKKVDPNLPIEAGETFPVLLTGDACYHTMEEAVVEEANRRGYIAARFNRLEIATDIPDDRSGGIYDIYPEEKDFKAISSWAWGYMVCMDVFEQLPYVDDTEVGITGFSRGGKTVMLAGAVDERIKYICPNSSGCHGGVSHRTYVTDQGDDHAVTERLSIMLKAFPHWMGKSLIPYDGREQDLPFDMHYFGALIAPRYYFQIEGMQDYWINPIGSWQNIMAVKACHEYLGCKDHVSAWFRIGEHQHTLAEFQEFMEFMDRCRQGLPLREQWQINPYPDIEKNFDW